MSMSPVTPWILVVLGPLAIAAGWLVFRFDSMVRATYALMVSFLATAILLLALNSEFMFAIIFLMMIGEMMPSGVFHELLAGLDRELRARG